jgi:hypothetical protein
MCGTEIRFWGFFFVKSNLQLSFQLPRVLDGWVLLVRKRITVANLQKSVLFVTTITLTWIYVSKTLKW